MTRSPSESESERLKGEEDQDGLTQEPFVMGDWNQRDHSPKVPAEKSGGVASSGGVGDGPVLQGEVVGPWELYDLGD